MVGAGVMGLPMAQHAIRRGHPLAVYARDPGKVASLFDGGARLVASPSAVAAGSDIVIGCLRDDQAVEQVYLGENGLLTAARRGQVLVEHGTISPALARSLAERAAERGAAFLDVPVTGGPQRARDGQLTGIAGGAADALASVTPLLGAYCSELVHVGPVGSGLELKLVNQLLVSVHAAAAAEAAAMIARLGLDPEASKRVLVSGWASSVMLDHCLPAALTVDRSAAGASIGGLLEVQQLVADLAASLKLPLRVFDATHQLFAEQVESGAARFHLSQLARAYDEPGVPSGPRPERGNL